MNKNESIDVVLKSRKMKKRQINRETIIKFAEKEFIEKGYEKARVEDIAFNSGNAKATIYNYFDSKEDILTAIIAKAYQLYIETLTSDLKLQEGKNVFKAILDSYLHFDEHYPYYSDLISSTESMLIIQKIYEKSSQDYPLTESEKEYKDREAETVNLLIEVFTKYLNKAITDRETMTKLIQAFAHFALTVREIIMRGKIIKRSNEETLTIIETMFRIIELGIKNYT